MIIIDYIVVACGIISTYNIRTELPFWNGDSGLHVDFLWVYYYPYYPCIIVE